MLLNIRPGQLEPLANDCHFCLFGLTKGCINAGVGELVATPESDN